MTDTAGNDAGALSRRVLDSQEEQAATDDEVLFPDDLLPGVGSEEMSLREGLAKGGAATFIILLLLNSLDELEAAALAVLAPEIRDSFGIGEGVIVFLGAASVAFVFLGAMPMGWLADRCRRGPVIGAAGLAFGFFTLLSGLARNVVVFFFARLGTGIAKSNTLPRPRLPHRRPVPDRRARPNRLAQHHDRSVGRRGQPHPGGRDRHPLPTGAGPTTRFGSRWPWWQCWPSAFLSPCAASGKRPTSWAKRSELPIPLPFLWKPRSPGSTRSQPCAPCFSVSPRWASGSSAGPCSPRCSSRTSTVSAPWAAAPSPLRRALG